MPDAIRPAPPPLEFRPPNCSICCEETTTEPDMFVCEACDCSWNQTDAYHAAGEWNEPDTVQCPASVQPYLNNVWIKDDDPRKHAMYRCVRTAGHDLADTWRGTAHLHAHPEMTVCEKGWA